MRVREARSHHADEHPTGDHADHGEAAQQQGLIGVAQQPQQQQLVGSQPQFAQQQPQYAQPQQQPQFAQQQLQHPQQAAQLQAQPQQVQQVVLTQVAVDQFGQPIYQDASGNYFDQTGQQVMIAGQQPAAQQMAPQQLVQPGMAQQGFPAQALPDGPEAEARKEVDDKQLEFAKYVLELQKHKYGEDQPQLLECAAIVDQAEVAKSTDGNLGVCQILMRLSDTGRKLERAQGRIDAIEFKDHCGKKKELEEARDQAQLRVASAMLQAIPAGAARGRAIRGALAKTVDAGGLNEHTEASLKAEVEAAVEVLTTLMERVAAQPPPPPPAALAAASATASAGAPAVGSGAADAPMDPAEEPVAPDPTDDEQEFWASIGLGAAAAAEGAEGRDDLLAWRKRAWEATSAAHKKARDGEEDAFKMLAQLGQDPLRAHCDCKDTVRCARDEPFAMREANVRRHLWSAW
ncbi:unnamed protein product [Prorocentrum cordatum]|uniref:Uncharacterized protein n=1 Tax=Prorocentrum cordatum TaxID=2364126 RepID=A0ABN9WPQ4_9DINO|nr:unnamed protein product [Polarella glacialis]